MRILFLFAIFAIAVTALPLEIYTGSHLSKRSAMDDVLAGLVKAAIAFGVFLWGGGIVARRGVNYYFKKLEEYEKEKATGHLIAMTRAKLRQPDGRDSVESKTTIN